MPPFIPEYNDAPVLVLFLNADHTVGYINDWGCRLIGYSREEVIGKRWIEAFVVHENIAAIQLFFDRVISGEVELIEHFENHIRSKDGVTHLFSWNSKLVRDGQGKIIGMITFGTDYTDRKTLLKALGRQELAGKAQANGLVETARFPKREDIAFELHDNINQVLTSCKLLLEQELAANRQLHFVQRSSTLLSTVIDEVRTLSHHLNALPVHYTDFELSLMDFFDGVKLASGLQIVVEVNDNELLNRAPAHVLSSIYRSIQEHISLIIKHARATKVLLSIVMGSNQMAIRIEDDGQDANFHASQTGNGSGSIQNRINLNRGSSSFYAAPGGGHVLEITIPLG